jgi:hypothetical protein
MVDINNNMLRQPPQPMRRPQPMAQKPMGQPPQMPMRQPTQPPALRAKQFQGAAKQDPLAAMRMAGVTKKPIPPMVSPQKEMVSPPEGLGSLPSNISLTPEKKENLFTSDFNLNKDVLKPAVKPLVASLLTNALDKETKQELDEGIKEEKEEATSIAELGRQSLGSQFAQLNPNTYNNMSEEQITLAAASGGGLMNLAAQRDFRGQVPGIGHGMQDNVYMPIEERGEQVATLAVSPKEYVVDAHTMSALGNGNADQGAMYMDEMVKNIREQAYGTSQQPNQINGLAALRPMMERV